MSQPIAPGLPLDPLDWAAHRAAGNDWKTWVAAALDHCVETARAEMKAGARWEQAWQRGTDRFMDALKPASANEAQEILAALEAMQDAPETAAQSPASSSQPWR